MRYVMVSSFMCRTNKSVFRKLRTGLVILVFTLGILPSQLLMSTPARAACVGAPDVPVAVQSIIQQHAQFEDMLMRAISLQWATYRAWLVNDFFRDQVLAALMLMTQQMTAVAMHQVFIFGTFMDAKHQLETQRLFQELQVQAHKDYHPSEDFCWFGTAARGLSASEQRGRFNAVALGEIQQARHLGNINMAGAKTADDDKFVRWNAFTENYCNPDDNNRTATADTGLVLACPTAIGNTKRVNIDIDYTRAIDEPRTLDINFTDGSATSAQSRWDEDDIVALSKNLYGNDVLSRNALKSFLDDSKWSHVYLALRSVAAKRSVAENSFNSIVGLKSAGTSSLPPAGSPAGTQGTGTNRFLGAILTELGVPPNDVYSIIGRDPSYYAQLELLAKKIYQNPDFYTNLYDKPANVARKGVALKAIELMLDRAIYESQLRQEMVTSVLLSTKLRAPFREVNKDLPSTRSQ